VQLLDVGVTLNVVTVGFATVTPAAVTTDRLIDCVAGETNCARRTLLVCTGWYCANETDTEAVACAGAVVPVPLLVPVTGVTEAD
jgi:hypothetical protein